MKPEKKTNKQTDNIFIHTEIITIQQNILNSKNKKTQKLLKK